MQNYFTKNDLEQIKQKGIDKNMIERQIQQFIEGFDFVNLIAAVKRDKGLYTFNETNVKELALEYEKACKGLKILKFVPASGAASRMFKHLFEFLETYDGSHDAIKKYNKDQSFNSVFNFINNLEKFPFYEELSEIIKKEGKDIKGLIQNQEYNIIIDKTLNENGLNYSNLPKGLIKFHSYKEGARLAVEEHLVESAHYGKEKNHNVRIHFTVSPEHMKAFEKTIKEKGAIYEKAFDVKFNIKLSIQKPSTDTIAVDLNNQAFRNADGSLLFRPGGHGALIENLNELDADIIFIKNIDNIVPDKYREDTYIYKKVLGGLLIRLQKRVHAILKKIESQEFSQEDMEPTLQFMDKDLFIVLPEAFMVMGFNEKTREIFHYLNRPMRICGMVKNEGEPGGGPFWVKGHDNNTSMQIVESSQINMNDEKQLSIVKDATHFNPVDLICATKDYKGNKFNLKNFIDPTTGFISYKSKNGKQLKALELPGLWNGAMAKWISVFAEVPISTFNPVKTVNDLLRDTHQ